MVSQNPANRYNGFMQKISKKQIKKEAKKKFKTSFKKHPVRWILIILAVAIVLYIITPIKNPLAQPVLKFDSITEELALPAYTKDDIIVQHTGYTLCYSEQDEQPYWVAYVLTADEVFSSNSERDDNFHEDPSIPTGSATLADYRGSGYDRGHMIPAADLKWSAQAMDDSFFLSNMSPQVGAFNRGIWADLESAVRTFAAQNQEICVVTGPVLTDGPYKTIGNNKVSVPNYYYKVILDYYGNEKKAIGFILPNEGSNKSLKSFAVSVDDVEKLTGLDFFCKLPDDEEQELEATFDVTLWDISEFNASKTARKYGYDLDSGEYKPDSVVIKNAEPTNLYETVAYWLFQNLGPYKVRINTWVEKAIKK